MIFQKQTTPVSSSVIYLTLCVNSYQTLTPFGSLLRTPLQMEWTFSFPKLDLVFLLFLNGTLLTSAMRLNLYKEIQITSYKSQFKNNLQNCIQQGKGSFDANLVHNFAFSNDSKYLKSITKTTSIPSAVFFDDSSANSIQ